MFVYSRNLIASLALVTSVSLAACNSALLPKTSNMTGDISAKKAVIPMGKNAPEYHLPQSVANTPFSYSISDRKLLSNANESTYQVEGDKLPPNRVLTNRLLVSFKAGHTQDDVNRFLQDFKGSLIERHVIKGSQDGKIKDKTTDDYLISFNYDSISLDGLEAEAKKQGQKGHFVFSDPKVAKCIQQVYKAQNKKQEYSLIDIIPDGPNDLFWNYTEGAGNVNSTGGMFWNYRDYFSGSKGNSINTPTYSAWDHSQGYGVKVAVVDSSFLNTNEPGPFTALTGTYPYAYVYNQPSNNYNISTGAGHGREVASCIFAPFGDSQGSTGVAPQAFPMLIHTDTTDIGFRYGIDFARNNGAKIINMSWGRERASTEANPPNRAYTATLQSAYNEGRILVCAAGNTGNQYIYPAAYGFTISVSSHDYLGAIANGVTGFKCNSWNVDIWAGAESVSTASLSSTSPLGIQTYKNMATSGAAAMVSGALALYVAQGKISTTEQARTKLYNDSYKDTGRAILDVNWGVTH